MTAAQSSVEALRIAARAAEEKQGTNLFAVDASDAMVGVLVHSHAAMKKYPRLSNL